jgi:hypothetical protein
VRRTHPHNTGRVEPLYGSSLVAERIFIRREIGMNSAGGVKGAASDSAAIPDGISGANVGPSPNTPLPKVAVASTLLPE